MTMLIGIPVLSLLIATLGWYALMKCAPKEVVIWNSEQTATKTLIQGDYVYGRTNIFRLLDARESREWMIEPLKIVDVKNGLVTVSVVVNGKEHRGNLAQEMLSYNPVRAHRGKMEA